MHTSKIQISQSTSLNVFDSKTPNKKTLIFIHGGAGNLLNWKHQIKYFMHNFRVIAYDWRGCGQSETSDKSYTFGDHYSDLIKLLEKLRINHECTLIGYSYGCLLAWKYLETNRKTTLVNIAMCPKQQTDSLESLLSSKTLVKLTYPIVRSKNPKLAKYFLASKKTQTSVIENFLHDTKIPPVEYLLGLKTFRNKQSTNWVNTYSGNLMIIGGKEDKLEKLNCMERFANMQDKPKLFVIEDAGHLVIYEKPDEVNNLINDFLST